jgi:hypothetical protein
VGSLNVAKQFAGQFNVIGGAYGSIGSIQIGQLLGGSLSNSGFIQTTGNIGATTIGSILGGAGANSGFISANAIGALKIGTAGSSVAAIAAGAGASSGVISSSTSIHSVSLLGNLDNSAGHGSDSGAIEASGSIGSVTVQGSILGGRIVASQALGPVTITGNLTGETLTSTPTDGSTPTTTNVPAIIAAGGVGVATAIAKITIDGSTSNAQILAGYEANSGSSSFDGLQGVNAHAQIGIVNILGNVTSTDIVAGAAADSSDEYGASASDNLPISPSFGGSAISKIASVIIGGQVTAGAGVNGIVAEYIGAVTVGGTAVPLTPGKDYLPVMASTNFFVEEIP